MGPERPWQRRGQSNERTASERHAGDGTPQRRKFHPAGCLVLVSRVLRDRAGILTFTTSDLLGVNNPTLSQTVRQGWDTVSRFLLSAARCSNHDPTFNLRDAEVSSKVH